MAAPQIFRVLTEFRFETGSAIASSGKLQQAVQGISNAADQTLFSFQRLSLGIVTGFLSGPGGGILGVLGTAVSSSESFRLAQVGLANVLGRSAGTFAERMDFAQKKLKDINDLAKKFALPSKDLVEITKILTPVIKTKLSPSDAINKSIDLGRFFLKAAPTLNIDPSLAIGQLQRAVLGFASAGDPLFRILTADTEAMVEFVGQTKKFNALPITKRIQKLTDAFKEFGDDAGVLEAIVNSIGGQFRILKENLTGMFSILKPLGDILKRVVIQSLQKMNSLLDTDFRQIIANIANGLEPFTRNAQELLITLLQLRELGSNFRLASNVLLVTGLLLALNFALGFLGIKIPFVTAQLARFAVGIAFLEKSLIGGRLGAFLAGPSKGILGFFNLLTIFVSRLLVPLGALVFIFQLLSRAAAIVKVRSAEQILKLVNSLSAVGAKFLRLVAVFVEGFNNVASVIADSSIIGIFFKVIDLAIQGLDNMVDILIGATAGFVGFGFAILEFLNQIRSFLTGGGFDAGAIGKAFEAGATDIFERVFGKIEGGSSLSQANVNINKVEINNDFKEKIEPDRVAFTVVDQLMKAALNPVGASGRPSAPAVGA